MPVTSRLLASVLPLLAAGLPAAAQNAPSDPLATIRASNALSPEQRDELRGWVDQRIAAIVANEGIAAQQAVAEIREEIRLGSLGSSAYQRALAEAVIAAASSYKNADLVPAARLMAILNILNRTEAHAVLLEALKDKRPAVRATAASALRTLRAKLSAAGDANVTATLTALAEAGKTEPSPTTLKIIYMAMDYRAAVSNLPTPATHVNAILSVLEARAAQYSAGKIRAPAADYVGLNVAGRLRTAMNEADRRRLTIAVAKMLKPALTKYTSELFKVQDKTASRAEIELRNGTELLIAAGEQRLRELLSPPTPPDVSTQMKDKANPINMKVEWNAWADLLEKAVGLKLSFEDEEDDGGG